MKSYQALSLLYCIIALFILRSTCLAEITLLEAKSSLPDGSQVSFSNIAVTASFPGCIYAEAIDRSQGIRINTDKIFSENELIDVSGTIETDPLTGERYIFAYPEYPQRSGGAYVVKPVGMNARAVTGGDCGLQQGIAGDANLNNIGLLVTIWGTVTAYDYNNPARWFKISDSPGTEVKIIASDGVNVDKDWKFVRVTGVVTAEKEDGMMIRAVKVRRQSDIVCHETRSAARLALMTLDEKIGQLFQIRIDGPTLDESERQIIQSKHIGGVVYFQYNGNLNDPVQAATLSNDLQECAIGPDGRGIPLLLSLDQEGGRVTRITGGAEFPGNMALGASRSAQMSFLTGSVFGAEIKAIGANMDLAPVLDVNNNPLNPVIGVRSFGEQAQLVSDLGIAYMEGLHSQGVLATGKHFPGHGDTAVDSHTGLPIVTYDFETLDTIHGKPFRDLVNRGLDAIMTAHIVVTCLDPNHPATLSPQVIEGYLRTNIGFDGVVMTDSMGMAGITSNYTVEQAAVMAVQAGVDMLSLPPDLDAAFNAIKSAVLNGQIPLSRIDQAVTRILRLKYRSGVFDNPYVDASMADDIVGNPDHRNAELIAARAGVTLVQNLDGYLPLNLSPSQKILLVTVQSSETTTDAATRFAAIMSQKHSNIQSIPISANPTSSERNNVKNAAVSANVVIVGTSRAQLSSNSGQATLVNQLVSMGKPVVVVGLREPYELASFPGVKAYVAAYNYRNCGFQAAADVIFGDVNPSGVLPVTIPGLYPFGHGLSY